MEGVFGDGDDCRVGEAIDDVHVCADVAVVATPTAFRTLCGLRVDPPDMLSATVSAVIVVRRRGGYGLQLPGPDPFGPAFLKHPVRLEVQAIRVIAITRAGVHAG